MMKYKYLLFDADDTLLDFKSAEKNAFYKLLKEKGIEPTPLLHKTYSDINQSVWERFEIGTVAKDEIGVTRYREFLEKIGYKADAADFDLTYHRLLGFQGEIIKDTDKVCEKLCSLGYSINVVTNGFADTQKQRFSISGLNRYIDRFFISESIGVQKPEKAFFDYVFKEIEDMEKSNYLIIGDSLTSDILGGINAGIDTCLFNPRKKVNNSSIIPTYMISSLEELFAII